MDTRQFGNWRTSIMAAVDVILKRFRHLIPDGMFRQARERAQALQANRDRRLPCGTGDRMLCGAGDRMPCGAGDRMRTAGDLGGGGDQPDPTGHPGGTSNSPGQKCVQYVHQIYGLFGDAKPMPELFQQSNRAWSVCAAGMGATYVLWDAPMVETLMRTHFTEFWEMYKQVRFPVMRADIGRIAILHAYGGLYADLDTTPNRSWYAEAPLAICSVFGPEKGGGHLESDWRVRTADGGQAPRKEFWDMEVLVGAMGSPFLLRWLAHIRKQIDLKDYRSEGSFWYTARDRYIYPAACSKSRHRAIQHVWRLSFEMGIGCRTREGRTT